MAYALYTVLGRGLASRYSPLLFCGVTCLGGAVATLPFAVWELAPVWPSPLGWALLAYLGGFVTSGFVVWFWGLRALPTAQAGALVFLQPLSAYGGTRPRRPADGGLRPGLRPGAHRRVPGGRPRSGRALGPGVSRRTAACGQRPDQRHHAVGSGLVGGDGAEAAGAVVGERGGQLLVGVHHERPVPGNGLADRECPPIYTSSAGVWLSWVLLAPTRIASPWPSTASWPLWMGRRSGPT